MNGTKECWISSKTNIYAQTHICTNTTENIHTDQCYLDKQNFLVIETYDMCQLQGSFAFLDIFWRITFTHMHI